MRGDTTVGYTYQADYVCPDCMENIAGGEIEELNPERVVYPIGEDVIRLWAKMIGVDYIEERSYDSDDFPKVILAYQIEEDEHCGVCHEVIPAY